MLQKGFTLLELMIVIAIFTIISSLGVASYTRTSDRVATQEVVDSLATSLGLARIKAMTLGERVTLCPVEDVTRTFVFGEEPCRKTGGGSFLAGGANGKRGWIVFSSPGKKLAIGKIIDKTVFDDNHGRVGIAQGTTNAVISFSRKGSATRSTIVVSANSLSYIRKVVVSPQGRIRTE